MNDEDILKLVDAVLTHKPTGRYLEIDETEGIDRMKVGYIASDLGPRAFDPMIANTCQDSKPYCFFVGYDGKYLENGGGDWAGWLKKWAIDGRCSIDYLLAAPSEIALEKLRTISTEISAATINDVKLNVYTPSERLPHHIDSILRDWQTFHFGLFNNPKQLWTEQNHLPGEPTAENCAYHSPGCIEKSSFDWDVFSTAVNAVRPYLKQLI